jgi:hypothetical protein
VIRPLFEETYKRMGRRRTTVITCCNARLQIYALKTRVTEKEKQPKREFSEEKERGGREEEKQGIWKVLQCTR